MQEFKQVIVARTDLKMGKGKLAAQVAHAALASAEEAMRRSGDWYDEWKLQGQAKVVVKGNDEAQLQELLRKARSMGLPSALIQDQGLTQLEPGTVTCLAIGPAPSSMVDKITGDLKLL
jgi:peptidyl-tRNA hydrolase, PTH2 family